MSTLPPVRKFAKAKYGGKRLSRQRRWQLARIRDGKCKLCGKPRGESTATQHCGPCWEKVKKHAAEAAKTKRAEKKIECEKEGKSYRATLKHEREKAARKRERVEQEFLTEAEAGSTKGGSLL
jgi:hypothetical protein